MRSHRPNPAAVVLTAVAALWAAAARGQDGRPKKTVSDVDPVIPRPTDPVLPKAVKDAPPPAAADPAPPPPAARRRPAAVAAETAAALAPPGPTGGSVAVVTAVGQAINLQKVPPSWGTDGPQSFLLGDRDGRDAVTAPFVEWWSGVAFTAEQADLILRHCSPASDATAVPAASILPFDQETFKRAAREGWRWRLPISAFHEAVWLNLTVVRKPLADLPRGVYVMVNRGHTKYPIDRLDATFVPLPEGIQSATHGATQAQLLAPRARSVVNLHLQTVFGVLPEGNGYDGLWTVDTPDGKRASPADKYTRVRDFSRDGLLTPLVVPAPGADEALVRPLGIVLKADQVKPYLDSDKAVVYPFWLFANTADLWAPFDKRFALAPDGWRGPLLDPERVRAHKDIFYKLLDMSGTGRVQSYLPLAAPQADDRWRLLFTRTDLDKLYLLEEPAASAADPGQVRRREYAIPTDLRAALADRLAAKEYPDLTLRVRADGEPETALWLTVAAGQAAGVFPGGGGPVRHYPLYLLHDGQKRAVPLFAFRRRGPDDDLARHKRFLPTLLNPNALERRPKFLAALVAAGPDPLEPIRFADAAGRWAAGFLQHRGDKINLVTVREEPDGTVASQTAEVPDDLVAAVAALGDADGLTVQTGGDDTVVGLSQAAAAAAGVPVRAGETGPLWLLRPGRPAVRPLAVPAAADWDGEPLAQAATLAGSADLRAELARAAAGQPFLVLPLRGLDDRYLYQPAEVDGRPGRLVRVGTAAPTSVAAVAAPPAFRAVIGADPGALSFRRVDRPAGVVLAVLNGPARAAWLAGPATAPAFPLWILTADAVGAPLLARRPDGRTPLAPDDFADTLLDLDALASRPGRIEFLRGLAARGGASVLSVSRAGGRWEWLLLDVAGSTLYAVTETGGADQVRAAESQCPPQLLKYLCSAAADPAAVRTGRAGGPAGLGVVWLAAGPASRDPRRDYLDLLPADGDHPYPVWLSAGGDDRLHPQAVFSHRAAGGPRWLRDAGDPPAAYRPETLLGQPALAAELLSAAPRGLWAVAVSSAAGTVLTSGTGPSDRVLLVENAAAGRIDGTPWRRVAVGPAVKLDAFLPKLGPAAAAFGATLRELPADHGLWWAEPSDRGGVGFAVGPAAPPADGWPPATQVRLAFTLPSGKVVRRANAVPVLLAQSRRDQASLPAGLRRQLATPAAPAAEWEYLRELAAAVVRFEWRSGQPRGWGADPNGLFRPDPGEGGP